MFERVISQTIHNITTQALRERPTISLVEILEDERIPTRLKPFFETEVRWWLYNEMLARQANKRFDYDHPELASLLSYLEQVQFRHARFEREDFTTVLDSAVKLTYNYLCRPQTTLKWYVFRGQPVMPLHEVMLRFGAFIDYPYFPTVFNDWVERKQRERPTFDAISATEFERVIRRVDDQILLNCTVEDLLGIINPIFEFVGEGEEMLVPVDALIIFFDDKNIKRLVDFLEQVRGQGRDVVSREDFVTLLDELLSSAEDEPEADFSDVYQNDELDDVVRRHLESGATPAADEPSQQNEQSPVQEYRVPVTSESPAYHSPGPERQQEIDPGDDDGNVETDGATGRIDPEDHRRFTEAFGSVFIQPPTDEDAPVPDAAPVEGDEEPEQSDESHSGTSGEPVQDDTVNHPAESAGDPDTPAVETTSVERDNESEHSEVGDAAVGGNRVEDLSADEAISVEESAAEPDDSEEVHIASMTGDEVSDEGESAGADQRAEDSEERTGLDVQEPEDPAGHRNGSGDDAGPRVNGQQEPDDEAGTASQGEVRREESEPFDVSPARRTILAAAAEESETTVHELEDVRTFITPMLERKILKRVFNRDRDQYEAALNRLNEAGTWRAASQVLDEVFIRFEVDPYSRTAIRFTDSIYGRYLPRN